MTDYKPKLIEVALPLAVINAEAAREKSIRHGHPSTLHLWWARRPLAAARAVIWASLVDDPSGDDTLTESEQERERQRLFRILERLVKWENSNVPEVLAEAKAEIDRCFPDGPPPVLDPFGGGGTIPLEAQRLGLKALSGDLNPVAVLIQKAMIEIPPRFAGRPPVHPDIEKNMTTWTRAQGLAADVEAYGRWVRDEAERRIGHLYPSAVGRDGERLTPIAWIWARTVASPNPAWSGHVPLVASWKLAARKGRPLVWIEPTVDRGSQSITYRVREGGSPSHDRTCSGGNGICLATGSTIPNAYIKSEGLAGRLGTDLMAIVAQRSSGAGRAYCSPDQNSLSAARSAEYKEVPTASLPDRGLGFRVQPYGFDKWWKLFTPRQLAALEVFSDLIGEVRARVEADAAAAGSSGGDRLHVGGGGGSAYADAVATYLAFALDKSADYWSSLCSWHNGRETMGHTFGQQTVSMNWDFAECNPFSTSTGSWMGMVKWVTRVLTELPASGAGEVIQRDARARVLESPGIVVSTDPPYYDNVGYADLSDFFYVWLRRSLSSVWPEECATLLTPKVEELIADPGRHGGSTGAQVHFESGMADFMEAVRTMQSTEAPSTIYYAYKATESHAGEVHSTGWSTFLQAILDAGLRVTSTWPMRTELANRIRGIGSNALASSVVLSCRPRSINARLATRAEFVAALRSELPAAVHTLQSGNVAPVDLAQSTIGPGISVFSRYARVVEADGSSMSVSDALSIINNVLGEVLDGEEAELDADTRFASSWFAQHGYNPAGSGEADGLARAKNTSLGGIQEAGIGEARAGKFRLYERSELDPDWSPVADDRLTVWEATQHLVAALERSESEAAALLHQLGGYADRARQLSYVLFQKAADNGWADEAGAYNTLITAWPTLQAMTGSDDNQQQLL